MKFCSILCVVFLFRFGSASWLGDVFTGLSEGLEDALEDHKDILDVVKSKLNETAKEFVPLVEKGKTYLKKWKKTAVKEMKKNLPESEDPKVHLLNKWEQLVEKITDQSKKINLEHVTKKLKKINLKLKKLLPKDLFEEMQEILNSVLIKTATEASSAGSMQYQHLKRVLVEQLGMNEKNFSIENIKKFVSDAAQVVNKGIKHLHKKIIPKMEKYLNKNGEDNMEEEENMEVWIKKNFLKPHHKSGSSQWKQTFDQIADGVMASIDSIKPTEKPADDNDESESESSLEDYEMGLVEKEELKNAEKKWEERIEKENEDRAAASKMTEQVDKSAETKKRMMTGNENWDVYKQYQKERESRDDPIEGYMEDGLKGLSKKVSEKFGKDIAGVTSSWISLEKNLLGKMKKFQSKLTKKYDEKH